MRQSDFGLEYTPQYISFDSLLKKFDRLYKSKAPLRYSYLKDGIKPVDFYSNKIFKSMTIPEDLIKLLQWKNGFNNPDGGWMNEFEEDSWYELIPLDISGHFMSLELIEEIMLMWQDILKKAEEENQVCYWKKGFIPFLMQQNFGLIVIDTVGYFNGQPGQIIYFDYKCKDGYLVIHENLNKWLETELSLLNHGLLFSKQEITVKTKIKKEINDYYTSKFKNQIPLSKDSN